MSSIHLAHFCQPLIGLPEICNSQHMVIIPLGYQAVDAELILEGPPAAFDLVLARLALHYVADLAPVFTNIFRTLAAGAQFVFSVGHPVITSCDRGWVDGTPRQDWVVDNYFSTGVRVTD
ncbi:methyltransferase domain-containing protein [Leptolyngbya sp. FACHB-541]|uniref:methyltransferase domain-containing protein n=1 Tax=Leptolyngbya sp. FACHB-541 TaxID=2692810 RepID=UPI0018F00AEA|nr:methyltransferase domain-containing protein [Leptolyngbya sp. FACHB-541]